MEGLREAFESGKKELDATEKEVADIQAKLELDLEEAITSVMCIALARGIEIGKRLNDKK